MTARKLTRYKCQRTGQLLHGYMQDHETLQLLYRQTDLQPGDLLEVVAPQAKSYQLEVLDHFHRQNKYQESATIALVQRQPTSAQTTP